MTRGHVCVGLLGRARELLKGLNVFVIRIESAAGTNARHGASASFRFFSRPFPERRAETMTSLRRCVKCMFLDRLLALFVVAESDVYTDVALALELAATGSHHHIA